MLLQYRGGNIMSTTHTVVQSSEAIQIQLKHIAVSGELSKSLLIPNKETQEALTAQVEPEIYYSAQELLKDI